MTLKTNAKLATIAAALAAAGALAGCGVDDVQLNGKIFDAVGLNTGAVKAKEPTLAARQPLVVPPGLEGLPQPGSGKAEQPVIAGVEDHDAKNVASKEELQQQQAAFCKKNYEMPKAQGDDSVESVEGPLGPCRNSIFSAVQKWNKGEDESAAQ